MSVRLEIHAHAFPLTQAIETDIRRHVDNLARHCDRLTRCRVHLERPSDRRRKGSPFVVRLELTVPGVTLAISKQSATDFYVALHEAFRAARSQLERTHQQRAAEKPF